MSEAQRSDRREPAPDTKRAGRLAALLASVPDGEMRLRLAERELGHLEADECARVLALLVRWAAERTAKAREAIAAIMQALAAESASYERRAEIYREAVAIGATEAAALLLQLPAQRVFEGTETQEDVALARLTLGHRKSLARGRDADLLARLAGVAEPSVVRNLLQNPRVTEGHVVRLAARRPVLAETLVEVARSRRFASSRAVRRALVRNPYTPVDVALRLVPLLLATDWRELARDPTVQTQIRQEARQLLDGRGGRERARAEAMLDPAEERRRLDASRKQRAEARRAAEEEERRREEDEARDDLVALVEYFEANLGAVPMTEVRDEEPAPAPEPPRGRGRGRGKTGPKS